MKSFIVVCLTITFAFCFSPSGRGQGNSEATKIARQGSEAAKDKDWENAVESFRKAAALDRKYTANLHAALQQRATAYASEQRFPEAIADYDEAQKLDPKDAGVYERRAYVEMKLADYDKALADYSEAIKLNPNEVRYYLYRGYILETRGDVQGSMADTEKALKLQKKNKEALSRKQRLEARLKAAGGNTSSPAPSAPAPAPPVKKHKR